MCSIAGVIALTDRARDAIRAFHAAAARWDPDVQLRLVPSDVEVRAELAEGPEPGDEPIEVGELTIFVAPGIEGTVDAGDHNVLTVTRS